MLWQEAQSTDLQIDLLLAGTYVKIMAKWPQFGPTATLGREMAA